MYETGVRKEYNAFKSYQYNSIDINFSKIDEETK